MARMHRPNIDFLDAPGSRSELHGQGHGSRAVWQFHQALVKNTAKYCQRFFDVAGDFPLAYRERQAHSVLLPAVFDSDAVALREQPIKRKKTSGKSEKITPDTPDGSGWSDYYIAGKRFTCTMELKHGYHPLTSSALNQGLIKRWKSAVKQLEGIDAHSDGGPATHFGSSLLLITTYISRKKQGQTVRACDLSHDECLTKLQSALESSSDVWGKHKPNFAAAWKVPEEISGVTVPYECEYKRGYHPFMRTV